MATGSGTKADAWVLMTAPGTAEYAMQALGLAELTHDAKNNRMRAKG